MILGSDSPHKVGEFLECVTLIKCLDEYVNSVAR